MRMLEDDFSSEDFCQKDSNLLDFFKADFYQPDGSFRFSSDALLLRDFTLESLVRKKTFQVQENETQNQRKKILLMDLGCGCGVVGLSLLMSWYAPYTADVPVIHAIKNMDVHIIAVEREPILVEAALQNAEKFNFSEKYTVIQGDISHQSTVDTMKKEIKKLALSNSIPSQGLQNLQPFQALQGTRVFDGIMCNPPWRQERDGNPSPSALRQRALFGDAQSLDTFFRFSQQFLKKHASLFCVGGASHLINYINALGNDLRPVNLEHVHYGKKNATFFLLEACYQSKASLCVSYPKLYENV